MYDKAAKITSNKVNISIVFIGHPLLFTRGQSLIGKASASYYSITRHNWLLNGEAFAGFQALDFID